MISKRMKMKDALVRVGKIGKCRIDHDRIINPKDHEVFVDIHGLSDARLHRILKVAARRKWAAKQ